ncbi:MAG: signal peptide peptidase SppA [Deltaproteobacteria bacterium]|nr:signal peptide peptidase SppA [Deltaproteobacteria bacterium]
MMSKFLQAAMLASLAIGCKPTTTDSNAETKTADDADDSDDASPMGLPPIAKLFTSGLDKPGPYEEPRHSEGYEDGMAHHLVLELSGSIAEVQSFDLMGGGEMGTPLRQLTDGLHKAAADENVKGLVVRAADASLDMATAEELRRHLIAFKGDGARSIKCHTESAANSVYYLLTACDEIVMAPLGGVTIPGPAATPIHVKGMLDKLGVEADFLHIGDFKGAAEPITREAPSPQMIETLEGLIVRSYETQLAGMQQGRGLDEAASKAAIDQAMAYGQGAVDAKLVDSIATWEDFLATTTGDTAWKKWRKDKSAMADFGALQRFLGLLPPERPSGPHVALVYAVGNVIDGKGGGTVGARQEIASRTLVATLRAMAKDDDIKAVVLRVSSGGGSALASEQIWQAMAEVKKHKPVVVSMGNVAASSGYYIAAGANKIFANANTITGSIGVVGGKIVMGNALESIGVKTYEVHRGERALMYSAMQPWTDSERELVRSSMEHVYEQFLAHVAAGRGMERDAVHKIAQGRVWTGTDAKANGLVDEIGGLDEALAEARTLAGVGDDAELEVYPGEPTIRDLITSFGQVQAGVGVGWQGAVRELAAVASPAHAQTVASLLSLVDQMRGTQIWAVNWVQPLR